MGEPICGLNTEMREEAIDAHNQIVHTPGASTQELIFAAYRRGLARGVREGRKTCRVALICAVTSLALWAVAAAWWWVG